VTSPSAALATWLVEELVARGLTDAVLCPGSRNAPLSFALAADPRVRLHTRIDERTAGFLALGLARASHRPVAVVTTSGTATANLHPAVLEAAHVGVTLVPVTADRPARLRGTGANQTTDQIRLYGDAASFADLDHPDPDALAAAWHPGGPIHLNVQLDDPLIPIPDSPERVAPPVRRVEVPNDLDYPELEPALLALGKRTVVVAGDDAGPPARRLAEEAGWPLLAEPSSGSRTGTHPIRSYRLLLGTPLGQRVERAVVFGHPTLSRPVLRLLARQDVEVVSVPTVGRWPARPFPVDAEHAAVRAEADDPSWLEEWRTADRELSGRIDAFVREQPELTPYDVAAAVDAANPPGGLLVVGASNPIRDLDLMAGAHPVGERRMVLANRGLAGIDGTLSSAIGAALGRPRSTRAIAYVGDVTFLHDATALFLGPDEPRPDLTIVVANDDGGSVFATLEQGAPAYADRFEQLFGTPHHVDLASLCAASRTPHWRVDSRAELEHALAAPNGGIEVVEAVIRRDNRRELDEGIRALATTGA
jgi:2-succinyl-5-enolpyruvyl-6-hydroxy-3-cyclohexene-1-carboxylate synthase